jgi:hypothetical protein
VLDGAFKEVDRDRPPRAASPSDHGIFILLSM